METLNQDWVWGIIKKYFMCDNNEYSAVNESPGAFGDCLQGKTKCGFCAINEVKDSRDLFTRMFRSEAEHGALQGELFSFLRNHEPSKLDAIKEYKRSCLVGSSRARGDIAIFDNIQNLYPKVMIELKHWSSFQGAPSEFVIGSNKKIKRKGKEDIHYSSIDIFDEMSRWLNKIPGGWPSQKAQNNCDQDDLDAHFNSKKINNVCINISPLYLGFFTEVYPLSEDTHFDGFSFLKTYGKKRSGSINNLFCVNQNPNPSQLCPNLLIRNFTSALETAQGVNPTCPKSHAIGYAHIDQSISELKLYGRLHCFAVWPK
jgi:hypothetical protein